MDRSVIVKSFRLQNIEQARVMCAQLIRDGKKAYLTREMGKMRYGGVVNVHVSPPRESVT